MQHHLLLVAAGALAFLGIIHSYLGERYIVSRILALPNLPTLRGSREYMQLLLRWAWHLTSIAWWGTAGTLVALWAGYGPAAFGAVLAITFAIHGAISFSLSRGRHPAWPFFLLASVAIWLGTH